MLMSFCLAASVAAAFAQTATLRVPVAAAETPEAYMEKLRDAGITDIVVNVHHFPDMIIDAVRANDGWGTHITISDERDCLLDTGGGLRKAGSLMGNGPVLACNVDILSNIDIKALVAHYEENSVSQLVVSERQTQRYLCFNGEDLLCGWINIATGEMKPSSIHQSINPSFRRLAFSGMQILNEDALARLQQREETKFSLIPFYLDIMEEVPLHAYVPQNYRMMDVGKIDQITEAERFAESLQ